MDDTASDFWSLGGGKGILLAKKSRVDIWLQSVASQAE
jgi:hypothetical protein